MTPEETVQWKATIKRKCEKLFMGMLDPIEANEQEVPQGLYDVTVYVTPLRRYLLVPKSLEGTLELGNAKKAYVKSEWPREALFEYSQDTAHIMLQDAASKGITLRITETNLPRFHETKWRDTNKWKEVE
jgi:hypothetical protein